MLKIQNLVKTYKSKSGVVTTALNGISYTFPETGMVFIVGKSGSGKSTLLNILGLLDGYDSGELIINGKVSKDFTQAEYDNWRALNIGFVFQEFHIIDSYSIGQNIALSLEIQNKKTEHKQIADALNIVGLEGYQKRKSTELSGGQRQRVAIARALIKDPKVILADEPTGNLDSENSKSIFDLLKRLSEQKLVVIISHDFSSAQEYADEVLYLEDGRIADIQKGRASALEAVEQVVDDKIDVEAATKLLKRGKKVVLVPKNPPQTACTPDLSRQAITESEENNNKNKNENKNENEIKKPLKTRKNKAETTRLPTKSRIKLALMAIKSKWVRLVFTIILSCAAISFIGFSDIIGQYNTAKLIKSGIDESTAPFVSVAAQSIESSGMLANIDSMNMLEPAQIKLESHLKANGIEYLKKHQGFSMQLGLDDGSDIPRFSNRYSQRTTRFFFNSTNNFVTIPDGYAFNGIELTGRLPQNRNEVVITNYHLETYKRFGFKEDRGFTRSYSRYYPPIKINDFSDIEGKRISSGSETEYGLVERYTIVGMLSFDLSAYQEFFDLPNATKLTKEQSDLLQEAQANIQLYMGNLFVHSDFIEHWQTASHSYQMHNLYAGRGVLEYSMEHYHTLPLTETNFPYRYADHNPDTDVPDYSKKPNFMQELRQSRSSSTNSASFEFTDGNALIMRNEGEDPYAEFRLRYALTTTGSSPTVTVDANFSYRSWMQVHYRTNFMPWFMHEASVTMSRSTPSATLPLQAGEQITHIRIDIDNTSRLQINNITIDGLEFYAGNDVFPPYVFLPNFTKDNLSDTNKAVIDLTTFATLLGDEISGVTVPNRNSVADVQDFLAEVQARKIDLTNFVLSFSKGYDDTVLAGQYQFEVVGIFTGADKFFGPTSDFGKKYRFSISSDYLLPRAGQQNAIISLLASGVSDTLPLTEAAPNVWTDYTGDIRFVLRTTFSEAIFVIDNYFSLFVKIFNIASIVFCVFAMLLTYNFVASSINARKKDIGILRSLGAKRSDIAWIFVIEVIIIAIIEIIVSCLFTLGLFGILEKYFFSQMGAIVEKYTLVKYKLRQVIIMMAVAISSIAVSVALPIIKITTKNPVDIIKSPA